MASPNPCCWPHKRVSVGVQCCGDLWSSRNVTHFICAAVKSPAVWGAIDLTSYYRGAEAGGGRQEHDTDNSWGFLPLHVIMPSPTPLSWLSSFSLHFRLSSLLPAYHLFLRVMTPTLLSPSTSCLTHVLSPPNLLLLHQLFFHFTSLLLFLSHFYISVSVFFSRSHLLYVGMCGIHSAPKSIDSKLNCNILSSKNVLLYCFSANKIHFIYTAFVYMLGNKQSTSVVLCQMNMSWWALFLNCFNEIQCQNNKTYIKLTLHLCSNFIFVLQKLLST